MKHIIFFLYLFDVVTGAIGMTIVILTGRKHKTELHVELKKFMLLLLFMAMYDFLIYYTDYIIGKFRFSTLLRFGNCIIALIFCQWIYTAEKIIEGNVYIRFRNFLKKYTVVYIGLWIVCTYLFSHHNYYVAEWLMLISDVGLILIFLGGSAVYIGEAVWSRKSDEIVYYLVIVSASLLWNYISYFWGEASTYWGNSGFVRQPLDLTIFFWCTVNVATLYIIYKVDFDKAYNYAVDTGSFDLNSRLEEITDKYELTQREKELVSLIYEGKSNAEIASVLFISESTVKTHVYNIFRKLNIKNRMQLACVVRGEALE